MDCVTYAISASDLCALSSPLRALVTVMLHPYIGSAPTFVTTQHGAHVLPLRGDASRVRRAIFRAQVMAPATTPVRFYKAYAPGRWDLIPSLEAVARMRAEEGSDGGV